MKNKSYKIKPHMSCSCDKECSCKNCECSAHARFFDTLGNETRLYILYFLRKKEKNVSQIVEDTGLEQTQVSHALKQLEASGLVTSRKEGKFKVYTANRKAVEPLMKLIDNHVQRYCGNLAKPCCCGGES